ncbi:MAG: DNA polymerase III subunit beta [Candidatus Paceibacterota bacterium]|jgi:DNA polymerase-3 subunit beta
MKIECVLEKLQKILPVVERITGKNLTLNVLSSILVIASGKTLKMRATNLDIGIEVELPAKIEKEGVVAVRGATLNELLSNLNEKTVVLESIGDNLSVKTSTNASTVKCYPYGDFPTIPLISGNFCFEIDSKKFLSGMKSVCFSSSVSDIKPEISSVYIYPDNEDLVFVATDSFRLAEKKIKIKNLPDFHGLLVPYKNVVEMIRVLDLADGGVRVCFNKNQISISYDGVYLTSRLIDGVFPDYKQIIPKEHTTEAVLLKQDLINALKINNIFLDKFNQIYLSLNPKEKAFSVSAKSGEVGETSANISAALKGEEVGVNLNYRFLFDVFQSVSSDSVSILFLGPSKPIIINGVGDTSFTYLVMPLNR